MNNNHTNHTVHQFIGWVSAAVVMAVCAASLIAFYTMANEPTPMIPPFRHAASTIVPRGGTLTIVGAVEVVKRCDAIFSRNIYGADGRRIASESEWRPALIEELGAHEITRRSFWIPPDAALGEGRYVAIVQWQCNFIQRLLPQLQAFPEIKFTIVPERPGMSH